MKMKINLLIILTSMILGFSATANAETYFAYLNNTQEVPANVSTARGYARMTYNPATKTLNLTGVYNGLCFAGRL